jgi:UDP-N-acetylglucosamine diphosphorylase / glucose-1-phosphate thymidylyltransferase / UDP-N-acetylgalactosamine diphosphorylase / glucosamine-1-phosphate N-acetyltransferase / galactosamine-1-phosphate N-acetyltransferase
MEKAIILAAGKGSKMWPYNVIRPKCMLPVGNEPLLVHQVRVLRELGITQIRVAAHHKIEKIQHYFRNDPSLDIQDVGLTKGTAETLLKGLEGISDEQVIVLYGDILYKENDLKRLLKCTEPAALVGKFKESGKNHIGCLLDGEEENVKEILGHSREKTTHQFLGFAFPLAWKSKLGNSAAYFPRVDVGVMPPEEVYLEAVLSDLVEDGERLRAVQATGHWLDLDKPWHLLEANYEQAKINCQELKANQLEEGAHIDKSAHLGGFVRLGKNSSIGRNVIVEDNLWVGDNTHVDAGAFIKGKNCIGDNCQIGYGCYIEKGSVVGNRCKVLHGAELSGVLLDNVYLYHYMEIAGIVGENTDIGAGTVCGTLRFDDSFQTQQVKGRKENLKSQELANACYIGDHCRTGINSILLPGVKLGTGSIVGPGVMLSEDLEDEKLLLLQQSLVKKDWSPDKYGW